MNLRILWCFIFSLFLWQACGENQNEHPVRFLFPELSSHSDLSALARSIEVSLTPGKGTCLQKDIFATYRANKDDAALSVVRVQLQSEIIPEGKSLDLSGDGSDKIAAVNWLQGHSELLKPLAFSVPNQASDFTLAGLFYEPRDRDNDGFCDEELKNGSGVPSFSVKAQLTSESSSQKNDLEFKLSLQAADQLPASWSPVKIEILGERPTHWLEIESLYSTHEADHLHYHVPTSLAQLPAVVPGRGKLQIRYQSDAGIQTLEINDLSAGTHSLPGLEYKVSAIQ